MNEKMAAPAAKEEIAGAPGIWFRDPLGTGQCPGCHYPILQRLVSEVLEDMNLADKTIGCSGAGCISLFFFALKVDSTYSAHGRVPDVCTAIKRVRPDALVLSVQGDGDTIAIGTEAIIQAAARGEKFTVIMANNGCYGNTGGQMAPTTLLGQATTTSSQGRDPEFHGYPIRTAELLATLDGVAYIARGSLHSFAHYQRTKKYIRTAFQKQLDKVGFSFVEVISACPPNWKKTPLECLDWIEENAVPAFPLGEIKNVDRLP